MELLKALAVMLLFLGMLSTWFFLPLWAVKYAGRALTTGQTSRSRWTNVGYSLLCATAIFLATYLAVALMVWVIFPTPIP